MKCFSTLFIVVAMVLVITGCSNDSPLEPAGPTSSLAARVAAEETNTIVVTFDRGRSDNEGQWSWNNGRSIVEHELGNPEGYLRDPFLANFCPCPGTKIGAESMFTGDYRARNVTSVGIDLRSLNYDWDITGRRLCVLLMNDNGTPQNLDDDWGAYFEGDATLPSKYVPMAKSVAPEATLNEPGWKSFQFDIPSQEIPSTDDQFPEGWVFFEWYDDGIGQQPGETWTALMSNVSYIQYPHGLPDAFYIYNVMDLGLDNPWITWGE